MTSNVKDQGHKVTWLVWAVFAQWPINSRSITKIGRRVPDDETGAQCSTCHRVPVHCAPVSRSKSSKVKVTDRLMQTHKMWQIFRTARYKNFKFSVRMEDIDQYQRQAPWPPRLKVKVTRSHRLYISSPPLINSGNKLLYLCH